ncbi:hypothetical protein LVJ94_29035 [Pendulispora rubella]|uniref:Uncharacterized protein n=1 Tax=Pendulispora rubella TaxID=2741070 RepID=A0ABZ2KQJ6_9BACT
MRTIIQLGSSNGNDETGNVPVSGCKTSKMAYDAMVERLDRLAVVVECLESVERSGDKANGGWPFFQVPCSAPAPSTPRRGSASRASHMASPRRRRRESEETRAAVQNATAGFVGAFM